MPEVHLEENPQNITSAQMVVAIPSYREAELIAYPTSQAAQGLKRFFGDKQGVIINCDNNSDDGTKEAFFGADTEDVPQIYLSTPGGKRQGQQLQQPFSQGGGVGRRGGGGGGRGPQVHHSPMDQAPGRAPVQRVRLRGSPVRTPQVRRHHHQLHRLSPDPGPVAGGCASP